MSMVAYMPAVAFQEEPYLLQQRPRRAPLGGYRHLPDHWRGTAPGLMNRIADAGALGRGRWGSNSTHTRLFRNSLSALRQDTTPLRSYTTPYTMHAYRGDQ